MNRKPPIVAATAAEILDDLQAADYLVTKPRTLKLWRETRGLPHLRLTGKVIRYRRSDLDTWLNQHRVALVASILFTLFVGGVI